ncbi:MAG: Hsp20/alpha crystallin family protein [Candidatus ainarchaeum sp.]|nr:Hsp20/alpha crystallin family protein [Candidatus ainarchaeum sp.]
MEKKEVDFYDPFRVMKKNFLEDFFEPIQSIKFPEVRMPLINVIDKGKEINIKVELPGIDKENINVDAHEDYIKIEANTKKEKKESEKDYYRYEMRASSFSRAIPMPQKIIAEKVTGKLNQGILELNAPKLNHKKEEKTKKVKIQ